ncbi:MAG: hypothetical protein AB7F32_02655 [Victivallaceae bacterium]
MNNTRWNSFSRALGLAALMLMTAGSVNAAEANQLTALAEQVKDSRMKLITEVDGRMADVDKLRDKESYAEADKILEELILKLTPPKNENWGSVIDKRRGELEYERRSLKNEWARTLMSKARAEASAKRYTEAMAFAAEAALVNPSLASDVNSFNEKCRRMMQGMAYVKETSIKEFDKNYEQNLKSVDVLLREAKTFYDKGRYEEARIRLERVFLVDPFNLDATDMLGRVYTKLYTAAQERQRADVQGMLAANTWSWPEPIFPTEMETAAQRQIEVKSTASDSIYSRMERIIFPSVEFDEADVLSVIRFLNNRSKVYDPDKEGINIIAGFDKSVADQLNRVTMSFSRIPMSEVLRYLCQDVGLKYKVDDGGIFIGRSVDEMQTQSFPVRGDLIGSITGTGTVDPAAISTDGGAVPTTQVPVPAPTTTGTGEAGSGALGKIGEGIDLKTSNVLSSTVDTRQAALTSAILKSYFASRGVRFDGESSIAYDRRANKLIVRNTVENLRRLDELLRQLDAIETPLVMVEIKLIEINENDWQELGFDWFFNLQDANNPQAQTGPTYPNSGWNMNETQSPVRSTTSTTGSGTNIKLINDLKLLPNFGNGIFKDTNVNLALTVNAVSRNDRSEVLSAPKLMTSSGSPASIRMTKQYYFPEEWEAPEVSNSGSWQTITVPVPTWTDNGTDIGIILKVTPQVEPDNYTVSLELHPEVVTYLGPTDDTVTISTGYIDFSSRTPEYVTTWSQTYNVWMPIIGRRKLDVNVKVYDGETIVLGGMIDNKTETIYDRWPVMGDIPLVGRLFSSQAEKKTKNNLLVFVTTRLVNNDGVPIRRNQQRGMPDFNR